MFRLIVCLLLTAICFSQQANAPLENNGHPIKVPFTCTEEDENEAGLTCTEDQPCSVYLELNGAETVLSRMLITGDLHTSDATLYSILLSSEDGGKTWTEPFARTRFTSLDQIQFIDFQNGWISGANLQGVPRDPFFLVTDDGGKSWRMRPIFDETRTGVVERFRFESKSDGELLITTKLRHELYETKTGGDSWTLKQFSPAPLRLQKERNAADSSIRVRADAKLHAYQVEKRQGDTWVPLSSFAVDAGKCK